MISTDATSIDVHKLIELCNTLRTLKGKRLPAKLVNQVVEAILVHCDVIRKTDIENLICIQCASDLRGCDKSAMFRLAQNGRVRVYALCHKDYLDRREIELLPPVGSMRGDRLSLQHTRREARTKRAKV